MTPPIGPQHSAGKLAHHNETHDELSKIHIHVHSEWQTLPERMLNKHCIQPTTRLYISLFLVVVASDNFLIITVASLPMAPKEEKTRGVNEHCLILFINSLYSLLSSLKFWNRNPSGLDIWTQGRNAFFFLILVYQKNAFLPWVQMPRTSMSALSSGYVSVVQESNTPVKGYNFSSISASL